MGFLNSRGEYYEGDRISGYHVEVPLRPSDRVLWDGEKWIEPPNNRALMHRLMTEDEVNPDGLRIWSHVKLHAPGVATDLFTALTGSGDEDVLLLNVRNLLAMAIETLKQLGKPFSDKQSDRIDEILAEASFDWRLSDLEGSEEEAP